MSRLAKFFKDLWQDERGFFPGFAEIMALLGGGLGSLFGGDREVRPQPLPPMFPEGQQALANWLFSGFFEKPRGGFDLWRLPTPLSPEAGKAAQQDIPGLVLGQGGAGTMDIMGQPLFPSIRQTRLPEVYANWQPWDAGTMYMADYLYNRNRSNIPDPRLAQLQRWGGTGGPGHQGMSGMMQYGQPTSYEKMPWVSNMVQFGTPSEAGRGIHNLQQFGVASQASGQPLVDLAYGRPSGAAQYLMPFLNFQRNPYMPAPIPARRPTLR